MGQGGIQGTYREGRPGYPRAGDPHGPPLEAAEGRGAGGEASTVCVSIYRAAAKYTSCCRSRSRSRFTFTFAFAFSFAFSFLSILIVFSRVLFSHLVNVLGKWRQAAARNTNGWIMEEEGGGATVEVVIQIPIQEGGKRPVCVFKCVCV